jgi:hypothetical protein
MHNRSLASKWYNSLVKKSLPALLVLSVIIAGYFYLLLAHNVQASDTPAPVPTASGGSTGITFDADANPAQLIINIYNFALIAAGAIAFIRVVWAGIMYSLSAGDPTKASAAISQLTDVFLGILLLFGAFILLRIINPGITTLTLPALSPVNTQGTTNKPIPPGSSGGASGGKCEIIPGSTQPCSVPKLEQSCFGTLGVATQASMVCNAESGGVPSIHSNCVCDGYHFVVGLFQINLKVHDIVLPSCDKSTYPHLTQKGATCVLECSKTMQGGNNCPPQQVRQCNVISGQEALLSECIQAAQDATINIANACPIYQGEGNKTWRPWDSAATTISGRAGSCVGKL